MKPFVFALVCFSPILIQKSFSAETTANFHQAPNSALHLKNPFKANDRKAINAGAELFEFNCATCHGKNAMGTGNVPALAIGPAQSVSNGELFWFIGTGSPQNGMPASPLPKNKRWQIVTFIKSLAGSPYVPPKDQKNIASESISKNAVDNAPAPAAPFTDYRYEKPGLMHKILPQDLPAPFQGTIAENGPNVVPRPQGAWPKVPDGFQVQLYATGLDHPRLLRTAPNGDIFLAEDETGKIRVFRGMTADGKPKQAEVFATGLIRPYGITFYPPGKNPKWIYVGDINAVMRFPYAEGDLHATAPAQKIVDLPYSPPGHWTRDIQFTLDGKKMFVAVGSASNVDDPDTSAAEKNRADILIMNPDGSDLKVYASGIRNAGGGIAINPATGELWASVNERDGLGDNLVPDYITHVQEGGYYGWPWWYVGGHQDPRHIGKHPELQSKLINPDVLLQPHHASLELVFYNGKQFPKEYSGDIFSSQHGSWNRSVRTGYSLIRVPLHQSNKASGEYEDFMTGFVVDNGHVWGRPVGVTVAQDGSLLVSDDGSNSIWRVSYVGARK
jgi:glucose/arabinose dehydrogenase/mono/diheme cytochrome c family protein